MTLRKALLVLSFSALFSIPLFALGQSASGPTLLVTWHAGILAPYDYQGHSFAGAGSPVVVSATLIDNGRIVNLDNTTVYWYVDGDLVESGVGKQSATVYALQVPDASIKVRAQIQNYKGSIVLKTVTIRTTEPEVVLGAPFPNLVVSGDRGVVRLLPYAFNVQNPLALAYHWTINGENTDDANPDSIDVLSGNSYSNGDTISVGVSVANPSSFYDQAQASLVLTYLQ
jgi:hypothetical protein